jgi:hypothetical protein
MPRPRHKEAHDEAHTITTRPKLLRRLLLLVGAVGALMLGTAAPGVGSAV